MTVELYGKKNCGICESAKDKMARLKIDYEFFDVDEFTSAAEGWREDGSVNRVALLALNNNSVPTIVIDNVPYTYSKAMAVLKQRAKKGD